MPGLSGLDGYHAVPILARLGLHPYQCMVDCWLQYRVGWYFLVQGLSTQLETGTMKWRAQTVVGSK
jgi:hypothetical protein